MRRICSLLTVAAALLLGALAPAAWADELRTPNAVGSLVPQGGVIVGSSSGFDISTSIGDVSCSAASLHGTIVGGGNPGLPAASGTTDDVLGQFDTHLGAGCTDTLPFIVVCGFTGPTWPAMSWRADGDAGTLSISGVVLNMCVTGLTPPVCTYGGNVTASFSGSTITFTSETITKTSGSSLCPGSGDLSTSFDLAYDADNDLTTTNSPVALVDVG